jgi:thiosulfate/3-mercaptopyruvate sulfurtransferase
MKKKRLISFFAAALAVVMAFGLTGCGSKGTPDSELKSKKAFTGKYIVSASYAKKQVGKDNVLFVDCRGEDEAKKGTVKGAVATTWQDLCTCSSRYGEPCDKDWGKIPEPDDLASRLGKLGMTKDKDIYLIGETLDGWGDDGRVLWELNAAGYTKAKIVNGGYDALENAGVKTQKGASEPKAGKVEISSINYDHTVTTEDLQKNYDDYKIIDTRTEEEYNGATKYDEAKGGHLPDAIFIPYTDLFRENGTLKSKKDIEAMMEDNGISKDDRIVTYCTGGIRSAYFQLVLEMCGYRHTYNYDQSYWRWCRVGKVSTTKAR